MTHLPEPTWHPKVGLRLALTGGLPNTSVRQKATNVILNFGSNPSKLGHPLSFRVFEIPINHFLADECRAGVLPATHRHDQVATPDPILVKPLANAARDVDTAFPHDLNGFRQDVPERLASAAANFDVIFPHCPSEGFRHLGSGAVAHACEQDLQSHGFAPPSTGKGPDTPSGGSPTIKLYTCIERRPASPIFITASGKGAYPNCEEYACPWWSPHQSQACNACN